MAVQLPRLEARVLAEVEAHRGLEHLDHRPEPVRARRAPVTPPLRYALHVLRLPCLEALGNEHACFVTGARLSKYQCSRVTTDHPVHPCTTVRHEPIHTRRDELASAVLSTGHCMYYTTSQSVVYVGWKCRKCSLLLSNHHRCSTCHRGPRNWLARNLGQDRHFLKQHIEKFPLRLVRWRCASLRSSLAASSRSTVSCS